MSKKIAPAGTGPIRDAKGKDVPGGRVCRSLVKGLTRADSKTRSEDIAKRRKSLNMLRAYAQRTSDEQDRVMLWEMVGNIGLNGHPTWEEVTSARNEADFLVLVRLGGIATRGSVSGEPVRIVLMLISIRETKGIFLPRVIGRSNLF